MVIRSLANRSLNLSVDLTQKLEIFMKKKEKEGPIRAEVL
jgi:hypothetical protein